MKPPFEVNSTAQWTGAHYKDQLSSVEKLGAYTAAPFKHGDRVRYLGDRYGPKGSPMEGTVAVYSAIWDACEVRWDVWPGFPLLEKLEDLERI